MPPCVPPWPSVTPYPGQGPPPLCAKREFPRQGAVWQGHPGVPATVEGGGAQKDSLRWAQGLGSGAAGWSRRGQSGLPGRLPRLRVWCLGPSNGALFPAQDPREGWEPRDLAWPPQTFLAGAQQSHWVRPTQGSRPWFPASSPTSPPTPGSFFHPGRFGGGRGRPFKAEKEETKAAQREPGRSWCAGRPALTAPSPRGPRGGGHRDEAWPPCSCQGPRPAWGEPMGGSGGMEQPWRDGSEFSPQEPGQDRLLA